MKHLGDITLIHGSEIEPVDCIIGGSPCQDLSVAGKRAGLSGERSGLFMEQIRIVKEMRKKYGKPRYMVWENVPGAFSSNNGEDFRAVLEEVTKIADETAVIPRPPKDKWSYAGCIMGDGWSVAWRTHDAQYWGVPQRRHRIALVADFGGESAPEILFERESVSGNTESGGAPWQGITTDAQGSPHADDRKGYESGIIAFAQNQRNELRVLGCKSGALAAEPGMKQQTFIVQCHDTIGNGACNADVREENESNIIAVAFSFDSLASNSMKSSNPHSGCRQVDKAKTLDCFDPNPSKNQGGIAIVEVKSTSDEQTLFQPKSLCEENWSESDVKNALRAGESKSSHVIVQQSAGFCPEQSEKTRSIGYEEEVTPMLRAGATSGIVCKCYDARSNRDSKTAATITGDHENRDTDYSNVICLQGNGIDRADTAGCNGKGWTEDVSYTLNTIDRPAVAFCTDVGMFTSAEGKATSLLARQYKDPPLVSYNDYTDRCYYIVRRLTPLECERLQGYPDEWTDIGDWTDSKGKKHKAADTPRYKALGNSIALPFWFWMLRRMSEYLPTGATMGSLFDGIGGFPLCWETIHGKGSARWASEIEEFPIAVTKLRFPEKDK